MPVLQQVQKLAGEAAMSYGVIGCCEIDKHSTSLLFSRVAILNFLSKESNLVYSRPSMSKASLFPKKQWIYNGLGMGIDKPLQDLKGDAQ